MSQPGHLFTWQRMVARLAAAGASPFDGPHARRLLAFCVMFSGTCRGTSGRECWLSPEVVDTFTQRSAERYLRTLVEEGLATRTAAPARGRTGQPGRRARYALNVRHDKADPWRTKARGEVADVRAQRADVPELATRTTSATAPHDRVAVRRRTPLATVAVAS